MISYKQNETTKNLLYTPQSFTLFLQFNTSLTSFNLTNNNLMQGKTLKNVQSILIDNSQSQTETIIQCNGTGQKIIAPPNSMLSVPILMGENELVTISNFATEATYITIILTDRMLSAGQYTVGVV